MKHRLRLLPLLLALLLLTGCAFSGADELYSLPRRSDDFLKLQQQMNKLMAKSEVYAAPISGDNRQEVQEVDLDGDEVSEVLAMTRSKNGEQPLRLRIFRREGDDFTLLHTIEIEGTAFHGVQFVQLDGKPGMELVVSGQIPGTTKTTMQALYAYTFREDQRTELLHTGCVDYTVTDLNGDGCDDIVFFTSEKNSNYGVAHYYRWRNGRLADVGNAFLSMSAESIVHIVNGNVTKNVPAVFVASTYDDNNIVTDVFETQSLNSFRNICRAQKEDPTREDREYDPESSTVRYRSAYSTDIDNDDVIELPGVLELNSIPGMETSEGQVCLAWYNLLPSGEHIPKCTTYHNYDEGWYLMLTNIYIETLYVAGDTDETLGHCTCLLQSDFVSKPKEILRIYVLEESAATEAVEAGSLTLLARRGKKYFCAKISENCPLDVAASFGFISSDTMP